VGAAVASSLLPLPPLQELVVSVVAGEVEVVAISSMLSEKYQTMVHLHFA
jgi:hypothetical protein